jgi:NADH:ubiquinone oxidoreductase subunit F (NADH-binding)
VMIPLGCPVARTARIVSYLAAESAGRCGPCVRGLPALADLMVRLASGRGDVEEVRRMAGLVDGRGACAHPDGTARLVRSLLTSYASEVDVHGRGRCEYAAAVVG